MEYYIVPPLFKASQSQQFISNSSINEAIFNDESGNRLTTTTTPINHNQYGTLYILFLSSSLFLFISSFGYGT
jgi:hypothetical protein